MNKTKRIKGVEPLKLGVWYIFRKLDKEHQREIIKQKARDLRRTKCI